jgi:hypothetical protein
VGKHIKEEFHKNSKKIVLKQIITIPLSWVERVMLLACTTNCCTILNETDSS